jgi:hypothetical protein
MAAQKFALVVEGEVFMLIYYDDSNPLAERWTAGLKSNPIVVDCTEVNQNPSNGWLWDGENFSEPQSE